MKATVVSIDDPAIVELPSGLWQAKYPLDFFCAHGCGQAFLSLLSAVRPVLPWQWKSSIIGGSYQFDVTIDGVAEFSTLGSSPSPRVEQDGRRGRFKLQGEIIEHLISGDGSILQTGDLLVTIHIDMVPADSLELVTGTWVNYVVEGLTLWPFAQE